MVASGEWEQPADGIVYGDIGSMRDRADCCRKIRNGYFPLFGSGVSGVTLIHLGGIGAILGGDDTAPLLLIWQALGAKDRLAIRSRH